MRSPLHLGLIVKEVRSVHEQDIVALQNNQVHIECATEVDRSRVSG
jgi:hypothetical protein